MKLQTNIEREPSSLLKPYKGKEIAKLYGIDQRTLNKWIAPFKNELGKKFGQFYNIVQVELIFDKLGIPIGIGKKLQEQQSGIQLEKELLTDCGWMLSKALLWPDKAFSTKEMSGIKKYIAAKFSATTAETANENFVAFCERIFLAKSYAEQHGGRKAAHPILWFNEHYYQGYEKTIDWYERLLKHRRYHPDCFEKQRMLALLFIQYARNPEPEKLFNCLEELKKQCGKENTDLFLNIISDLTAYLLRELILYRYKGGHHVQR